MSITIKSRDLPGNIAVKVFEMLNPEVKIENMNGQQIIITDVEPNKLIYPEGWYYAKGRYRNKHQSSSGNYSEIYMLTSDHELWGDIVKYCTLSV